MTRVRVKCCLNPKTTRALVLCAVVFLPAGCGWVNPPEVTLEMVQTPTPTPIEAPSVAFCELMRDPSAYSDTTVRTQAAITTFSESQYIYDLSCYGDDATAWVELDNKEAAEKLRRILRWFRRPNMATRVKVTVVGCLDGPSAEGFGHLNGFKYRFWLKDVETAVPIPPDTPWPWELDQ